MDKAREFQKNIYFCFIDYAKAFDCVDYSKLWKILQEMGIPARSQDGRSHPWQGHAERPDGQGKSGLKGSSVWASTPKPKSVSLLSAILYSSDITEVYPQKS